MDDREPRDAHGEPMSSVSFSLRPHHIEQLRQLAKQLGVSQSQLMREALDQALTTWQSKLRQGSRPEPPDSGGTGGTPQRTRTSQ